MTDAVLTDHRLVGKSTRRVDGERKITGVEQFTADVHIPGMLFARGVGSPYPHARVTSIDASPTA